MFHADEKGAAIFEGDKRVPVYVLKGFCDYLGVSGEPLLVLRRKDNGQRLLMYPRSAELVEVPG